MTELPLSRRVIKAVALIVISLGLLIHIATQYPNPLISGVLVLALAIVNYLCLTGLGSTGHAHGRAPRRPLARTPVRAR